MTKGKRVMMTLERASPGRSTPVQKLSVPKSTHSPPSRKASSILERDKPSPWTNRVHPLSAKKSSILAATERIVLWLVKSTKARARLRSVKRPIHPERASS